MRMDFSFILDQTECKGCPHESDMPLNKRRAFIYTENVHLKCKKNDEGQKFDKNANKFAFKSNLIC